MGTPFFAMFFIVLSIILIKTGYQFTSKFEEDISSYSWVKTQAVITKKQSWRKPRRKYSRLIDTKYYILYKYNVGLETMGGEVEYINENAPDEIVRGAVIGDSITVYYNPRKPVVSRYRIGADWFSALFILIINCFTAVLLYSTYEVWRIDSTPDSEYREHAHPFRNIGVLGGALTVIFFILAMIF